MPRKKPSSNKSAGRVKTPLRTPVLKSEQRRGRIFSAGKSPGESSPATAAVGQNPDSPGSSADRFPVAGIGASTGGLEAFEKFFQNMPPEPGIAFILVPHLDPTHSSLMTNLLKKYTSMEVVEIKNAMKVEPDIETGNPT